jgi:hypothetical protein
MTRERDFDRIARAWLELGPHEAPDRTVEAVLGAIEAESQVRRPPWWPLWRPTSMTRIRILAVAAGLTALAAGAAILGGGNPRPTPSPSTVPSPAVSPSAAPTTASTPGPVPAAILGSWIAPLREAPGITQAATSGISFMDGSDNPAEPGFALDLGLHNSFPQEARADEPEPGVLRLVSRPSPGGCEDRDVGRYRWSKPSDDVLVLELIADACAAREAVVPGTWIRSGIGDSDGGTGIAAAFTPFFEFSLPAGDYEGLANGLDGALLVTGSDGFRFQAMKDPDGFVDRCSEEAGRIDLEPGIDPLLAYLNGSPELAVTDTTELMVDGNRAVRIDLTTGDALAAGGCADGAVLMFAPHVWAVDAVPLEIGQAETFVVTEVDGATIVFEIDDGSGGLPQGVIDSIQFIDELPMP